MKNRIPSTKLNLDLTVLLNEPCWDWEEPDRDADHPKLVPVAGHHPEVLKKPGPKTGLLLKVAKLNLGKYSCLPANNQNESLKS